MLSTMHCKCCVDWHCIFLYLSTNANPICKLNIKTHSNATINKHWTSLVRSAAPRGWHFVYFRFRLCSHSVGFFKMFGSIEIHLFISQIFVTRSPSHLQLVCLLSSIYQTHILVRRRQPCCCTKQKIHFNFPSAIVSQRKASSWSWIAEHIPRHQTFSSYVGWQTIYSADRIPTISRSSSPLEKNKTKHRHHCANAFFVEVNKKRFGHKEDDS